MSSFLRIMGNYHNYLEDCEVYIVQHGELEKKIKIYRTELMSCSSKAAVAERVIAEAKKQFGITDGETTP